MLHPCYLLHYLRVNRYLIVLDSYIFLHPIDWKEPHSRFYGIITYMLFRLRIRLRLSTSPYPPSSPSFAILVAFFYFILYYWINTDDLVVARYLRL